MKAVIARKPGGPEVLEIVDRPTPEIGSDEVLIEVKAAGVNRPDIQQRLGKYPPPPGTTDILGLDLAGLVAEAGENVTGLKVGDEVCALVAGGGYAEYCAVPAPQCTPIPSGLAFTDAASLPEVFFTAWTNVFDRAKLAHGEVLLIQGGTSGVGLAALQMAKKLRNATVVATVGSAEKADYCTRFGADHVFDYKAADWAGEISKTVGGIDVILDSQAGDYTEKELALLNLEGRLVFINTHRGDKVAIDLRDLFYRRLTITGSTLRSRTPKQKGEIARALETQVWPLFANGDIKPFVQTVLPIDAVAQAHEILDQNRQIGKVVLEIS